ncbi:hypothetical protein KR018_011701 [Drosophila ironensis]|nr:hypothetical protein KR018_011701 [Drosophila ironensis]
MSKYLMYFCVVLLWWSRPASADHFDECEGVDDETFVQSWDSCQSYVYCQGEDSLKGDCEDGEYFDGETGGCDLAANVQCFLDEVDEPAEPEPEEPEVEEPEVPATPKPTELPSPPIHEPTETTTEEPTTTEESTTTSVATQPSIQTSPPVNTTASTASPTPPTPTPTPTPTPSSDIHVICKTSGKNGVYPYPANSNYYYQCIAGYLLLQQCPQNFHFEASQGQCISKKPYRSSSLVFHV